MIKSIKELGNQTDHIVFSNYVYDSTALKEYHPAGYQVVESVKNREVDRYIYGSAVSEELPEISIYSHSFRSFTFLGDPVAKISIEPLFKNL